MFFKNLIVYRLPSDWSWTAAQLEEVLAARTLQRCGPFEMVSRGWVAPSDTGRLLHTVNQQHLIALGVEQKLLPASLIRQEVTERAKILAVEQGFPAARRQMRDLKIRVTEELRSRALCRRRVTRAWIDPLNRWFAVDAAGAGRAEELVETLRETLGGSLAVTFLETSHSPQHSMSTWLAHGDAPSCFSIDQELELQTLDGTKASVKYQRQALDVQEVQRHLEAGKHPMRLGLTWSDRIAFILTHKLELKRLEFLDLAKDTADAGDLEAAERFEIDLTVMTGELARLLADLARALGGEVAMQKQAA
jgi:recombination associated protein RdgC